MGDLGPKWAPQIGTLGIEFELSVDTTKLCVLSKGDINWET